MLSGDVPAARKVIGAPASPTVSRCQLYLARVHTSQNTPRRRSPGPHKHIPSKFLRACAGRGGRRKWWPSYTNC